MSEAKATAMRAFNYLLDLGKYSLNNVSADWPEPTGRFYVRLKSDEEDGRLYTGEELIQLAKSEGWSG